ncbi:hypothetical protein QN219_23685 [Sinorhizobium sp. 7-81]|uniref:hypothetical protein n=1 Tax=Sinorhizobium sp. 8-89 TaxID=3049089 RepID=UPI0024C31E95|nr:hypothetical protein [Sinorhizobium sp. 8-89]MDK1493012.1 hypothetical protein [Sinorhizobium sp. 8-89]
MVEDELLEISAGQERLVDVLPPFLGRIEPEVARKRDVDVPGAFCQKHGLMYEAFVKTSPASAGAHA